MKKLLLSLSLIVLLLIPSPVFAWSMTGHRIIAEIAQKNVKSKTLRKISSLLDNLPMAYWANWPDFIKSDTSGEWEHTHIWHYVNAPGNLSKPDYIAYIKKIELDNIYREIPKQVEVLRDKVSSREHKRMALIFLIHLVGDMHQPMHVGHADDYGGNKIHVYWFNEPTNLHSIWDGKLLDYEKYSYSEYADILDILPQRAKKEMQGGELEDWLYESYNLANEIYSSVRDGDTLKYEYNFKYKTVVEKQLQRGGLRLASLLELTLK